MKAILVVATLVVALSPCAYTFGTINIDTVPVGDAGNPADTTHHGAVSYEYRIGKYEVTNANYTEFLNAVDANGTNTLALFDSQMASSGIGGITFDASALPHQKYVAKNGRGNQPVVYVNWYDAIRFANWLNNGQGSADTETGSYTLGDLDTNAVPVDGNAIVRSAGAKWFLPSLDEWYKAAYYQPREKGGQGYWPYPMQTALEPYSTVPPGTSAPVSSRTGNFIKDDGITNNYDNGRALPFRDDGDYLTDVGAYTNTKNYYGTFDQGGNVWEFTDTRVATNSPYIEQRGGAWNDSYGLTNSGSFGDLISTFADGAHGFRVASIPEPSSALLALSIFALLARRRCRR